MRATHRIPVAAFGAAAGQSVTMNGAHILTMVQAILVTTATVGNRQLELRLQDSAGNVLAKVAVGTTQAASLTRVHSFLDEATPRETTVVANQLMSPLPEVVIPDGGKLVLLDTANVDVADTVAITYTYTDNTM